MTTSTIYFVFGINNFNNVYFEFRTIDKTYADQVYNSLIKCNDIKDALIIDDITGEIITDFSKEQKLYNK